MITQHGLVSILINSVNVLMNDGYSLFSETMLRLINDCKFAFLLKRSQNDLG